MKRTRLNLGCGPDLMKGWVNVDGNPEEEPDVVADVRKLDMFETGTVDEIFASHILEHIDCREPVLEEWCRVLKPTGRITVVVPDIIATFFAVRRGGYYAGMPHNLVECDITWLNATVFGGFLIYPQFQHPGHIHRQVFLFDELEVRMWQHFEKVSRIFTSDVREITTGEIAVVGYKPSPINKLTGH